MGTFEICGEIYINPTAPLTKGTYQQLKHLQTQRHDSET